MAVILITGAAAGLGRALAFEARRRGHQLALVDRSPDVHTVAEETGARALVVDLADPSAVDEIAAWAPQIDVLVNNAGIAVKGAFHEIPADRLERLIDVNVRAPLLLARVYMERFRDRRSGTIVNVSSSATHFPTPGLGPYGASKAFLTALSETLEIEAGDSTRISVLCVCPAGMATDFQSSHGVRNEASRVLMDPARVAGWLLDDIEGGATGVRYYGLNAHAMYILRRLLPRRMFIRLTGALVARYR